MSCHEDDLEALARGELSPSRAREVEEHARSCDPCGRELEWMRAERTLMARRAERAPGPPPAQWSAIADRIAIAKGAGSAEIAARPPAPARGRRAWIVGGAGVLVAAAAAALIVALPRGGEDRAGTAGITRRAVDAGVEEPAPTPSDLEEDRARRRLVRIAVERAEAEYAHAIEALDEEYRSQRESLPEEVARLRDAEMRRLRAELDAIRGRPGDDVDDRLRAVQASAAYVRSMQRLVLQEETP